LHIALELVVLNTANLAVTQLVVLFRKVYKLEEECPQAESLRECERTAFLGIQFSIFRSCILSNSFTFSVTITKSLFSAVHPISKSKSLIAIPAERNLAYSLP
jgi:hypothetical protein